MFRVKKWCKRCKEAERAERRERVRQNEERMMLEALRRQQQMFEQAAQFGFGDFGFTDDEEEEHRQFQHGAQMEGTAAGHELFVQVLTAGPDAFPTLTQTQADEVVNFLLTQTEQVIVAQL